MEINRFVTTVYSKQKMRQLGVAQEISKPLVTQ